MTTYTVNDFIFMARTLENLEGETLLYRAKGVLDAIPHLPDMMRPNDLAIAINAGLYDTAVREHMRSGDRIRAITRVRELTGGGLKTAKDAVDALMSLMGQPQHCGALSGNGSQCVLIPGHPWDHKNSAGQYWPQ